MKILKIVLFSLLSLLAVSCASNTAGKSKAEPIFYASAVMVSAKGKNITGVVRFSEGFGKVKVVGDFKGLQSKSTHGIHIHEFGDCTAEDFSSSGAHFNPEGVEHGGPESAAHHAGDIGNLVADKKGQAHIEVELDKVSIAGSLNPLLGRAVILHENQDDLISQPTGGSGSRIACGVIGATAKQ